MATEGEYTTNPNVPMTYDYDAPSFYLRNCYPEYYGYVKDALKTERIKTVTITGTPGIGKSVFYLYFVNRYLRDNPHAKLLVAAVTADHYTVKSAMVTRHSVNGSIQVTKCSPNECQEKLAMDECDLFLSDGPPGMRSCGRVVKNVVFTSPNAKWFKECVKMAATARTLYMSPWSLFELKDAASSLSLGISDEEIERRFQTFGGQARSCLTPSEIVDIQHDSLDEAIGSIETPEDVKKCLLGKAELSLTSHRVFYMCPMTKNGFPTKFFYVFGSDLIAKKIMKNLDEYNEQQNIALLNVTSRVPAFRGVSGTIFECSVHRRLMCSGKKLELVELHATTDANQPTRVSLDIPKNSLREFSFQDLQPLDDETYLVPDIQNCPTFDAAYLQNNILYLFQCTLAKNHSVLAEGMVMILKRMNLLNSFLAGNLEMKLVFVIKDEAELIESYSKRLPITFPVYPETAVMSESSTDTVPGISPKLSKWLKDQEITNLLELKQVYESADTESKKKISRAFAATEKYFQNSHVYSVLKQKVASIQQFLCVFDFSDGE